MFWGHKLWVFIGWPPKTYMVITSHLLGAFSQTSNSEIGRCSPHASLIPWGFAIPNMEYLFCSWYTLAHFSHVPQVAFPKGVRRGLGTNFCAFSIAISDFEPKSCACPLEWGDSNRTKMHLSSCALGPPCHLGPEIACGPANTFLQLSFGPIRLGSRLLSWVHQNFWCHSCRRPKFRLGNVVVHHF